MEHIKNYFYKYLPHLGDLETYNEDARILDYFENGIKIHFLVEWLPAEGNQPPLLEIQITLRGIKKYSIKGWVYRQGQDWDFQVY